MVSELEQQIGCIAGRQRWSEDEAWTLYRAWRESGLSQRRFAQLHGLNLERVGRWIRLLRTRDTDGVAFHPVRVIEGNAVSPARDERIEIVLAGGHALRVPSGFVSEDLRRVLDVLEARA